MKKICMICKEELTLDRIGVIKGEYQAFASEKPLNYERSPIYVYHKDCEDEANKVIIREEKERYKRMGLID